MTASLIRVSRLGITRGGTREVHRRNVLAKVVPGEHVANYNSGGGCGPAWELPPADVHEDFRNGLVSRAGATLDYGVVIEFRWPPRRHGNAPAAAYADIPIQTAVNG